MATIESEEIISLKAIVTGEVQGVGFRYQTQRISSGFPVKGYVKNLEDGSVLIVVQGREEDAAAFIEKVRAVMASHILDLKVTLVSIGSYKDFSIMR
jgi:acylphosphatase